MRLNARGIALLEVIVAAAVALILGTIAVVSWGKIEVWRLKRKTAERLERYAQAFCGYWDETGSYAPDIQTLSSFLGIPPVDAWGQQLLYETDVQDANSGEVYPAVFVSPGSDGALQTSAGGGVIQLSERDIYRVVSRTELNSSGRAITKQRVRRATAALDLYLQSEPEPDPACAAQGSEGCPAVLVAEGYLEGSDGYDAWGNSLVVWNSQLISPGPDGVPGNDDDVLP